jgi:hypothetical protein
MLKIKVLLNKMNIHMLPEIKHAKKMVAPSKLMDTLKSKIVMIKLKNYKNKPLPLPLMLADGHHTQVVSSAIAELV